MSKKNKKIILERLEDGKFISSSSNFSFIGEGDTPEKAISSLELQEKKYLRKLKKYNLNNNSPAAAIGNELSNQTVNLKSKFNWMNEILSHVIKTFISIFLIVGILAFTISYFSGSINKSIEKSMIKLQNEVVYLRQMIEFQLDSFVKGKDTDMSFGDKLEKEINRGAESEDIPQERKDRIIKNLEITAERYKPYVGAIKKLFSD
jgi:hypothetical protein